MPISKGRKKPTFRDLLRKIFRKAPKPQPANKVAAALFSSFLPPEGYAPPKRVQRTIVIPETETVGNSVPANETRGAMAIFHKHGKHGEAGEMYGVPMGRVIRIDKSKNYRGHMGAKDIARRNKAIGGYHA